MKHYPVFLNLENKPVLLIGAGEVALRKAKSLLKVGAKLFVYSKEFSPVFKKFFGQKKFVVQIRKLPKNFRTYALIICATSDRQLNQSVYERAAKDNIWVNVVDDPKHSTFIVPSSLERGGFQVAVSTGGASPVLAKLIRKRLSSQFGPEYSRLVKWLKSEREKVKLMINDQKKRHDYFQKAVSEKLHLLDLKQEKRK